MRMRATSVRGATLAALWILGWCVWALLQRL